MVFTNWKTPNRKQLIFYDLMRSCPEVIPWTPAVILHPGRKLINVLKMVVGETQRLYGEPVSDHWVHQPGESLSSGVSYWGRSLIFQVKANWGEGFCYLQPKASAYADVKEIGCEEASSQSLAWCRAPRQQQLGRGGHLGSWHITNDRQHCNSALHSAHHLPQKQVEGAGEGSQDSVLGSRRGPAFDWLCTYGSYPPLWVFAFLPVKWRDWTRCSRALPALWFSDVLSSV